MEVSTFQQALEVYLCSYFSLILSEGTSEEQKGKKTITDGGSTVMHSKGIIGLDWT